MDQQASQDWYEYQPINCKPESYEQQYITG